MTPEEIKIIRNALIEKMLSLKFSQESVELRSQIRDILFKLKVE